MTSPTKRKSKPVKMFSKTEPEIVEPAEPWTAHLTRAAELASAEYSMASLPKSFRPMLAAGFRQAKAYSPPGFIPHVLAQDAEFVAKFLCAIESESTLTVAELLTSQRLAHKDTMAKHPARAENQARAEMTAVMTAIIGELVLRGELSLAERFETYADSFPDQPQFGSEGDRAKAEPTGGGSGWLNYDHVCRPLMSQVHPTYTAASVVTVLLTELGDEVLFAGTREEMRKEKHEAEVLAAEAEAARIQREADQAAAVAKAEADAAYAALEPVRRLAAMEADHKAKAAAAEKAMAAANDAQERAAAAAAVAAEIKRRPVEEETSVSVR